jgi:hypothetical protein
MTLIIAAINIGEFFLADYKMAPRIGLVMIVKDEEAVIERALRSAIPFISTWVIVDTGSTDKTKEIIQTVFADISGLLIERPWVNFGTNRSEALALCDPLMDWAIMIDADDNLDGVVPPAHVWANPEIDAFMIRIHHGSIRHQRTQIFRTNIQWRYDGVVHEFPVCKSKEKTTIAMLPEETYMVTRCEGARSKDPEKYLKDAMLLETELLRKPTDHRTIFYLAQSYRDYGKLDHAKRYYQRYLDVSGGWDQERYMTLVNLINLSDEEPEKLRLTWLAVELCPDRLEAQYTYLNWRRRVGLPITRQAYALAAITPNRKPATVSLFTTQSIYDWGMDDELAVAAFAVKQFRASYDASMRCALGSPELQMRENAMSNARKARDQMPSGQ